MVKKKIVIFENGLPKLSKIQNEEEIIKWDKKPLKIVLKNKSNIGEDTLKLFLKLRKMLIYQLSVSILKMNFLENII